MFDIKTLKELDEMLSEEILKKINRPYKMQNYMGLLRDAMMISDAKKYFEKAWQNNWQRISVSTYNHLLNYCPELAEYKEKKLFKLL